MAEEQSHDRWHVADYEPPLSARPGCVMIRDQNLLFVAEVIEEDAPMVASSPRLLAALKDMVKWYGKRGDPDDELLPPDEQEDEQVAEAMRAIEEAEGRS